MDDLGWSWPAWKFGLKREDLFGKIHDQYNTFPSSIQDPEAFHHDVCEISNTASTPEEFHCLLFERRDQRIRELHDSLESASLEIIASPKLIGTKQWQHAVQLFRTKSLDSLVRYFSSYLPDDHPWHHPEGQDATVPSTPDAADDAISSKPFFDDEDHEFVQLTYEPLSLPTSIPGSHLPPSPRSLTMCSDSSAASPVNVAHNDYFLDTLTPARTLSLSEPESALMDHSKTLSPDDDEEYETSQYDDLDTPTTSISDMSEVMLSAENHLKHENDAQDEPVTPTECEDSVGEYVEYDTPTPRTELPSDSYVSAHRQTKAPRAIFRPPSPLYTHILHEYVQSSRKSRQNGGPEKVRRTSPEIGRVQKPLPESIRARPKGRRRIE